MQSKTSWFKRGMITQDLRAVGWIGIIYQIALLFAVPLQLLMVQQINRLPYNFIDAKQLSLFTVLPAFQIFLMFTVPVVFSVILFRYLHVKIQADFIHSLPIKRTSLFHHHAFMGILLLIIPVVITALFIAIVQGVVGVGDYLSVYEIVIWAGLTILMNVFVFVLTTFIGTVTGISAVQVVLAYIFLVFPAGIMVLFYHNLKYFIYGFAYDYYFDQNLAYLTPIARMTDLVPSGITSQEIFIYIVLTIIFYVWGVWAYQKRKIEGATQAIVFRYLKPIFKYGVTFCTMLLGGTYFGAMQEDAFGWIVFGYFFGSVLGYVIAEMVLQKTWRIFKSMKGYLVYILAAIVIGLVLNFDITGYEKRLPVSATEIERAYFGEGVYWLKETEKETVAYAVPTYEYSKAYRIPIETVINETNRNYFTEQENVESILQLHQKIIEDKNPSFNKGLLYKNIVVAYELKNGSRIVRQYQVPEDTYKQLLKPIYESQEYRYSNYEFLRLKEGVTVDKISIRANGPVEKGFETVKPEEIEALLQALKTDMLQEPYEEMVANREPWGEIELLFKNDARLHISWRKSYREVEAWLQENDLLEQARTMPEDLMFAAVIKHPNYDERLGMIQRSIPISLEEIFENNEDLLIIEDAKQLEQCLYEASWHMDEEYLIALYYKNGKHPEFHGLEYAPSYIVEYFK